MILVAVSMVALIAMAALSIDVVTLYVAREEAQRAADAAALAAARILSVSGITTTASPDNYPAAWTSICGGTTSVASLTARAVAQENSIGGAVASAVNVTYSTGSGSGTTDCTTVSNDTQFGINPLVTVQVTRGSLPTLFSRIWSRGTNTVSASATAEVFNPSNSGTYTGGEVVPVKPRCVKPWIIPNIDPATSGQFVGPGAGLILSQSIIANATLNGTVPGIGEHFTLGNGCAGGCPVAGTPAKGNYIPALITPPATAAPNCANGANDDFQNTITGCDGNTVYACGTVNGAQADLTLNRGAEVSAAVECRIRQPNQDTLDVSRYPFEIQAGPGNPIIAGAGNQVITASDSIVSLPIYDSTANLPAGSTPQVTVLGFLQVFINSTDSNGNMDVYLLNVVGCSNDASTTQSAPGTSPVPIRLVSPP